MTLRKKLKLRNQLRDILITIVFILLFGITFYVCASADTNYYCDKGYAEMCK